MRKNENDSIGVKMTKMNFNIYKEGIINGTKLDVFEIEISQNEQKGKQKKIKLNR